MGLFKNGVGRPSNETIKKRRIFYVALIAVLGLTVAFAALSTTLTINGQAKVNKSSWNVHFDNLELVEEKGHGVGNTVGEGTTDAKIEESGIEINNLNAELSEPNDSVTYTVDIVNEGEIDAVVHINEYFENTLPNKLEVTALYSDDTSITEEEKELNAGETLPVTITIKYSDITDASDLLTEDAVVNIKYILVAEQKSTFASDSDEEEEIVTSLNTGDTLPSGIVVVVNGGEYVYANEEDIETLKEMTGSYEINVLGNTVPELTADIVIADLNHLISYDIVYDDYGVNYIGFRIKVMDGLTVSKLSFVFDSINGKNLVSLNNSFSEDDEIVDFSGYDIPDTVKNISYMFEKCSNLEKAPSIPVSVTRAEDAFDDCPKLTEVTYQGTLEQFKQIEGYDSIGDNGLVVHCTDGDYIVGSE